MKSFKDFLVESIDSYSSYSLAPMIVKDKNGVAYGKKATLLDNFDINKINFDENIIVAHLTSKDNIKTILLNGFRNVNGFDGTAVIISSKNGLLSMIDGMIDGGWLKSHKCSDSLILFLFPKKYFGRQSSTNRITLDKIDAVLIDTFNEKIGLVSPRWIECALIIKYRKI